MCSTAFTGCSRKACKTKQHTSLLLKKILALLMNYYPCSDFFCSSSTQIRHWKCPSWHGFSKYVCYESLTILQGTADQRNSLNVTRSVSSEVECFHLTCKRSVALVAFVFAYTIHVLEYACLFCGFTLCVLLCFCPPGPHNSIVLLWWCVILISIMAPVGKIEAANT